MATAEGVFPKIGNDPIYNSEINMFANPVMHYYSGTDLNLTALGSVAYELPFVPAGSIISSEYISLNLNADVEAKSDGGHTIISFLAQHKESGGSYTNIPPGKVVLVDTDNTVLDDVRVGTYNNVLHKLTTAEKASGLYINLQSEATGGTSLIQNFTLKQYNTVLS